MKFYWYSRLYVFEYSKRLSYSIFERVWGAKDMASIYTMLESMFRRCKWIILDSVSKCQIANIYVFVVLENICKLSNKR